MRKVLCFSLLLVITLSACSVDVDKGDELEEPKTEKAAEKDTEQTTEDSEKQSKEETTNIEETEGDSEQNTEENQEASPEEGTPSEDSDNQETENQEKAGLKVYMPDSPMKKKFVQNDEYTATYEIIATDDSHVQRLITFGDMVTLQILEWKEDKVSVVYEESNPQDTSNQLDTFESVEITDVLVDLTEEDRDTDWEILSEGETLSTDAKFFQDVMVVKRSTNPDSSGDPRMSITSYYAPGYGLVKEEVVEKGENAYSMITELKGIE